MEPRIERLCAERELEMTRRSRICARVLLATAHNLDVNYVCIPAADVASSRAERVGRRSALWSDANYKREGAVLSSISVAYPR